jgi:hypothetical protein
MTKLDISVPQWYNMDRKERSEAKSQTKGYRQMSKLYATLKTGTLTSAFDETGYSVEVWNHKGEQYQVWLHNSKVTGIQNVVTGKTYTAN